MKVFDPKADYSSIKNAVQFTKAASIGHAAENADMLLLLTEWPEFKQYDWSKVKSKMKTPIFFDAKNALDGRKMKESGFVYLGIGGYTQTT